LHDSNGKLQNSADFWNAAPAQFPEELQQLMQLYIWQDKKESTSCKPPFIDQNQGIIPMTGVFGEAVRNCLYKFHFSKSQLLNWLFLLAEKQVRVFAGAASDKLPR
jgi:hypothetical protein